MKISEIELVPSQSFPIETVRRYLEASSPNGTIDNFTVNYTEFAAPGVIQIALILTDDKEVAAYAGFVSRLNGKVWQARNAETYPPYKGMALVGKLYQYIKTQLRKSIQSDDAQSTDGRKLWTKTLPSLGLSPMIFDTETEKILDPSKHTVNMYPAPSDKDIHRYIWILEKTDHYPYQNLLIEGGLLLPYTGLWYNSKKEK